MPMVSRASIGRKLGGNEQFRRKNKAFPLIDKFLLLKNKTVCRTDNAVWCSLLVSSNQSDSFEMRETPSE